jgi:hypothetical protein
MAVTIQAADDTTDNTVSKANVQTYIGELLIVGVHVRQAGDGQTGCAGCTYNGVAMTELLEQVATTGNDTSLTIYYAHIDGTTHSPSEAATIAATLDGAPTQKGLGYVRIYGHNSSTPFNPTTAVQEADASADPDLDITTTVDNTLLLHFGTDNNGIPVSTDGDTQYIQALNVGDMWCYSYLKATAGLQNMEVTGIVAGQSTAHAVVGIRIGDAATYPTFDPDTDLYGQSDGSTSILEEFWSPQTTNVLLVGDSFMRTSMEFRAYAGALIRAWDHPAGYDGFHIPPGGTLNPGGGINSFYMYELSDDADAQPDTYADRGSGIAESLFADQYFAGAPAGGIWEWEITDSFDNTDEANDVVHATQFYPSYFDSGAYAMMVDDWWTGRSMTAKLIYMWCDAAFHADHDGVVAQVAVRLGAGDGSAHASSPFTLATDQDTTLTEGTNGLSDVNDSESGYNMLAQEFTVDMTSDSTARISLASVPASWEAALAGEVFSFPFGGYKLTGGPGKLRILSWGENSYETHHHAYPGTPAVAEKKFTNDELDRWFDMMYDDFTKPLYVVMYYYADDLDIEPNAYCGRFWDWCERIKAAWARVGGTSADVRFILLGTWHAIGGGADEGQCQDQNEGCWRVAGCNGEGTGAAASRSDCFYINTYGLTGGIFWDTSDTGGDQGIYAIDRGWHRLRHRHGYIDMSEFDMVDAQDTHFIDEDAAFAFAWIHQDYIKQLLKKDPPSAPTPIVKAVYPGTIATNQAGTYTISGVVLGPNDGLVVAVFPFDDDAADWPVSGIDWGAEALTQSAAEANYGPFYRNAAQDCAVSLWYLNVPATAGVQTVTITHDLGGAGGPLGKNVACALVITGHEQGYLEDSSRGESDVENTDSPSFTVRPNHRNCLGICACFMSLKGDIQGPGLVFASKPDTLRPCALFAQPCSTYREDFDFGVVGLASVAGPGTADWAYTAMTIPPAVTTATQPTEIRNRNRGRGRF